MYRIVGYNIMYGDGVNGLVPGLSFFLAADNTVDEVLKSGGGLSSGCSKRKRWKA
jgi:Amt family ammonium transporter